MIKFIEDNFMLTDDGHVARIRKDKFNGNGLPGAISFDDLEDIYLAGKEAAEPLEE